MKLSHWEDLKETSEMRLVLQFRALDPEMFNKMTWEELAHLGVCFGQMTILKMVCLNGVMTIHCDARVQTCEEWAMERNWDKIDKHFDGRWKIVSIDFSTYSCIVS